MTEGSGAIAKLAARIDEVDSLLCLGLDSAYERLPERFARSARPQLDFNRALGGGCYRHREARRSEGHEIVHAAFGLVEPAFVQPAFERGLVPVAVLVFGVHPFVDQHDIATFVMAVFLVQSELR